MKFRRILLVAAAFATVGCSTLSDTVDALNPFSKPAPKLKPVQLPDFKPGAELVRSWQVDIGASGEFVFTPAVVGTQVYVAARDGALARYDKGRQVWRISTGQVLSGGVGANDKLVVVGTPKGEVLAFQVEDGRPAWQARASSEILAAPALQGDLVAVRSGDARIFGFAASDGKRRWVYQRSTPALSLRSHAGLTMTDTVIYAGFPGGKLIALSRSNGTALWEATVARPRGTTEIERIADVASDPVIEGSMVCAVAYQGRIACFDLESGRPLWAHDLSSVAGLDMGSRGVYVIDDKSVVLAFDRNSGASLWTQDKLAHRGLTRPLVLGSHLAVADAAGYVHLLALDDGAIVARTATDGAAIVAAPRQLDGHVVVQTKNGSVQGLMFK